MVLAARPAGAATWYIPGAVVRHVGGLPMSVRDKSVLTARNAVRCAPPHAGAAGRGRRLAVVVAWNLRLLVLDGLRSLGGRNGPCPRPGCGAAVCGGGVEGRSGEHVHHRRLGRARHWECAESWVIELDAVGEEVVVATRSGRDSPDRGSRPSRPGRRPSCGAPRLAVAIASAIEERCRGASRSRTSSSPPWRSAAPAARQVGAAWCS